MCRWPRSACSCRARRCTTRSRATASTLRGSAHEPGVRKSATGGPAIRDNRTHHRQRFLKNQGLENAQGLAGYLLSVTLSHTPSRAAGHFANTIGDKHEKIPHPRGFLRLAAVGLRGVYYPLGVALSQIFAKDIAGARATAQVTKASAENLNLLQAGRGELALTLGAEI